MRTSLTQNALFSFTRSNVPTSIVDDFVIAVENPAVTMTEAKCKSDFVSSLALLSLSTLMNRTVPSNALWVVCLVLYSHIHTWTT
ncbi:hypothetical protein Ae201684_012830 [Aphanomyces euteiches]|uniref:Uncharacterized protein n=1 Tax=Aphanomyces euteiches TaxID=100861 RepID=A0A6G0WQ60_9STRA|nr:hypothetical protein Ae201684_012830 [Aphanomyces euteiches]